MAENLTNSGSEEGGRTFSNAAERDALIKKYVLAVVAENAAIKEIQETTVQDHRDVIKDIKAKVKKDLKLTMKAFNHAVKTIEIQNEAENNTDEDAGADLSDSMREIFGALEKGQMLNFLDALGRDGAPAEVTGPGEDAPEDQAA